ncbi:vinorine synthase [Quercus suber]|uniref:Vinorine synthase n=1 Tax=Quercus suber TaxID=58331 RepID=A0AAW0IYH9_QUESU
MKKFLPCDDGTHHLPFAVVNHFTCGGIAIGACISHKLADGSSFINFMKNWAATARCESVEALKAKYVESSTGLELYPSRNRYVTTTDQVESESEKLHIILYVVNLRRRMNPPLPDCSFGNLFQLIPAIVSKETSQEDWYGIVHKLRDAKRKLDKFDLDLVKEFSGKVMAPDTVVSTFSGLCGFPRYDVNFGWGKPLWIGRVSLPHKNLITLTDTKFGDGIEAWINLKEEEMVKFEKDKELLSYARI